MSRYSTVPTSCHCYPGFSWNEAQYMSRGWIEKKNNIQRFEVQLCTLKIRTTVIGYGKLGLIKLIDFVK